MEQMTVERLAMLALELIEQGYGKRKIVISDDNEGNGYHGLFYGFDTNVKAWADVIYDSTTKEPKELVILG